MLRQLSTMKIKKKWILEIPAGFQIEKTEDKDYYNEKVLQGDLGILIHEAFRKKEPIFYRVACTEGLML